MSQIYTIIRTDDYSPSKRDMVGFYSTKDLAKKAVANLAKHSPDFYNFSLEPVAVDTLWLFDPEEDKDL